MKVNYIRVSTNEQNLDRQINDNFDNVILDKISGSIKLEDRPGGKKLLNLISENKVSELHIHSLDRLGRNLIDILSVINYLNEMKVCLVSNKEGIRTLNLDKTINPMSKMLIGVLGTFAEFELERSKERQKEGIEKAKKRGAYVGRTVGTVESFEVLMNKKKNQKIWKTLQSGESVRRVALLCETSTAQVSKIKKLNEADKIPSTKREQYESNLINYFNKKAAN